MFKANNDVNTTTFCCFYWYLFTSFLVFLLLAFFEQLNFCWVLLYQFINVKITSCCRYKQMYKNLSEMVAHKKGLCSKIVVPKKIFFLVVYLFLNSTSGNDCVYTMYLTDISIQWVLYLQRSTCSHKFEWYRHYFRKPRPGT